MKRPMKIIALTFVVSSYSYMKGTKNPWLTFMDSFHGNALNVKAKSFRSLRENMKSNKETVKRKKKLHTKSEKNRCFKLSQTDA